MQANMCSKAYMFGGSDVFFAEQAIPHLAELDRPMEVYAKALKIIFKHNKGAYTESKDRRA